MYPINNDLGPRCVVQCQRNALLYSLIFPFLLFFPLISPSILPILILLSEHSRQILFALPSDTNISWHFKHRRGRLFAVLIRRDSSSVIVNFWSLFLFFILVPINLHLIKYGAKIFGFSRVALNSMTELGVMVDLSSLDHALKRMMTTLLKVFVSAHLRVNSPG